MVKKQELGAAVQAGYTIAEGIELCGRRGLHIGIAGIVGHAASSVVKDGMVYRGFTTLGGELSAGYVHPVSFLNRLRLGVAGSARAEYARYFSTDLVFFYMTAAVAPTATVQLADNAALRFSLPVCYSFRRDLSYHFCLGLASTFLLG